MGKWTVADMPDQTGRTAVVTGASAGIGFHTAKALAAKSARVVLAVRNLEKGAAARDAIAKAHPGALVELQRLELGSLESVRAAAEELRSKHERLDLLINNAGVMTKVRSTTQDGFELHLGTNHLGHFALTGLLLDRLLSTPGSRIVAVSSPGHRYPPRGIRFKDLQWERSFWPLGAYGQSKLANLMFTYELQRRLQGTSTIAVAAHPGGSRTDMVANAPTIVRIVGVVLFQSARMGALPTLRAATDPGVIGAQYYGPGGIAEQRGYPKLVDSNAPSHDEEAQRRLWAISEELTGVTYP
jgi:NAD(P)-dependent dehydrogenase (short-subunit alcohol dehydrogenase family)